MPFIIFTCILFQVNMNLSTASSTDSLFSVSASSETFDSHFFYGLFPNYPKQCHILQDLYNAITKTNSWDYIAGQSYTNSNVVSRHFTKSYDTSTHDYSCLGLIHKEMMYRYHTGQTYRWSMWHMKCIAKKGMRFYKQIMLENPERYIDYGRHSYIQTKKVL
jgi:hypothetical protein